MCADLYFDRRDELLNQKALLDNEWIEIETLFEEKDFWEMRGAWLSANQPVYTSADKISEEIFELAQATDVEGVTTAKQSLLPVEDTPHYVQAGVALEAKGELAPLLRWLYDLTRPGTFRVVRNLVVRPDKEEAGSVIATMELLRWYAPTAP